VAICLLAAASIAVHPQQSPNTPIQKDQFVLVRLKDRKPLANRHLVIFVGTTVKDARKHLTRMDADTNSQGVVTLQFDPKMRWFQVWHDVGKSCAGGIRADDVFHSSVVFDEGPLVSDTCGQELERLQPYIILLQPYPDKLRSPIRPIRPN
jgi:hypothetical protein